MPEKKENIYFSPDLSSKERACFEAGIKLGALYHILCGMPIALKEEVLIPIEKGIEAAISCQPYVKAVKVNLDREKIRGDKSGEFDYDEITGKIIKAEVIIEYDDIRVLSRIEWMKDLEYPLMYIKEIEEFK